jgi:hypothetical protein
VHHQLWAICGQRLAGCATTTARARSSKLRRRNHAGPLHVKVHAVLLPGGEPGKSLIVGLGAEVQDREVEPMIDIVGQIQWLC